MPERREIAYRETSTLSGGKKDESIFHRTYSGAETKAFDIDSFRRYDIACNGQLAMKCGVA
jgi:hypothetical protein